MQNVLLKHWHTEIVRDPQITHRDLRNQERGVLNRAASLPWFGSRVSQTEDE